MSLTDLSTPSLLVEQPRLETNLAATQQKADANDVALRPHVKTHKSVAIARRQQQRGAEGLTVAAVAEAKTFVDAGFQDVRVGYPVTGHDKHGRLQALRDEATISFTVDTVAGAGAMAPHASVQVDHMSEEHGWLTVDADVDLTVGDRLRIVPNHACVTVATQDQLYLVDGDAVVDTWTVGAHGW